LAQAFVRSFAGTVVSIDPISDAPQDFEPWISYFKLRNPDIVFVATTDAAGSSFLRDARRLGLNADFLGGDGWTGVVSDTANSEGVYVGAPFTAEDTRPEARRFTEAFRTRYRITPDGNAALAYDATMLVWQAIRTAGTNRKGIRDYLASLDENSAHKGVTGAIRFRENGDPVGKGFVMTRVRRGALVVANPR
jgi:branched-chain amino acid transport system substrate-binding protein